MPDQQQHSRIKEVPTHLFAFEERLFGVSLNQLLSDLAAGVGILALTERLPLMPRLVVGGLQALVALLLIHGRREGQPLLSWLVHVLRFAGVPRHSTWHSSQTPPSDKRPHPAVQATWITLDRLEHGIAGYREPGGRGAQVHCWAIIEYEGRSIRALPDEEQLALYRRFETFLCGLEFPLQFVTHLEALSAADAPVVQFQRQALSQLAATSRLSRLQQESIRYQEQQLGTALRTRHFVVVSAWAGEEEASREPGGASRRVFARLARRPGPVSRDYLAQQVRLRLALVQQHLQHLGVRAHVLDDAQVLQAYARSLAPGASTPPFIPRVSRLPGSTTFQQEMRGLHTPLTSESRTGLPRREASGWPLVDLLAPSSVDIGAQAIEVTTQQGQVQRFQSYLSVMGYGHERWCGWLDDFTDEVGMPLLLSTTIEPLPSPSLIRRLERQLVRLASQKLADQKHQRVGHAGREIEAEELRALSRALAARRLKVFEVQMTLGLHASTAERLTQRLRSLRSHARHHYLQVHPATHRQDLAWQDTMPTAPRLERAVSVLLSSDVLSTFLPLERGSIGTPTGVFLGWVASGARRTPVYYHPWCEERPPDNPHLVVIGQSGKGKSFVGKVLVSGLLGLGIADVVVLDKDDDYLPLQQFLGEEESQRYDLARGCPLNFFDLSFGPDEVDPNDPVDLLGEFLEQQWLTALTLLLCGEEERLSRSEEASLLHVARLTYAACGITTESLRSHPDVLLGPMPTLANYLNTMRSTLATLEQGAGLLARLERVAYLFRGQTSVRWDRPLTIFSIKGLHERWYAFMTFIVGQCLLRQRAVRHNERYLAYLVEEASYLFSHPAARKTLEHGARSFRKRGIAQITLSQNPQEFLREGAVILQNAGTSLFLGMSEQAVRELHLPDVLAQQLIDAPAGEAVMRMGQAAAALTIAASPLHRRLFSTTPKLPGQRVTMPPRANKEEGDTHG